jgi:hypothetical protein
MDVGPAEAEGMHQLRRLHRLMIAYVLQQAESLYDRRGQNVASRIII